MNLSVIVPVTTIHHNAGAIRLLEECKNETTNISVYNISKGPEIIETEYQEAIAAPEVIQLAKQLEESSDTDGILIYCSSDPGLKALKEILKIPVVGIGEAAMILSLAIGNKIGIIEPNEVSILIEERRVRSYGFEIRIPVIKAIDVPVLGLDPSLVKKKIDKVITEMIEDYNIDTIILGCGGFYNIDEYIKEKYHIPVIVPGKAGLKLLENIVTLNFKQHKSSI
jgi:allantoin racemase